MEGCVDQLTFRGVRAALCLLAATSSAWVAADSSRAEALSATIGTLYYQALTVQAANAGTDDSSASYLEAADRLRRDLLKHALQEKAQMIDSFGYTQGAAAWVRAGARTVACDWATRSVMGWVY